jgi:hypothetical protein
MKERKTGNEKAGLRYGRMTKRRGGRWVLLLLLAVLAAGLALGVWLNIGGLGSILGSGAGSNGPTPGGAAQAGTDRPDALQPEASPAGPAVLPTAQAAERKYEIVVRENDILYNGRPFSLEQLRETLLAEYSGEEACILVDDHAIKAAYDACKATLDDLNIPFIEK